MNVCVLACIIDIINNWMVQLKSGESPLISVAILHKVDYNNLVLQASPEGTMAIEMILEQQLDSRHGGEDCLFNGFLEDYLNLEDLGLDPILEEAFKIIRDQNPNTRICAGMKADINRDAISNQIIRYKDIFKLTGKALTYPYILYERKNDEERALLVVPYEEYSYLFAKGYYYCMTEPGSPLLDCKNEIVTVSSDDPAWIARTYEEMFVKKAGALQRGIDHSFFANYEELKDKAVKAAEIQKEKAYAELPALEDRTPAIYKYVVNWFLLKKVLYVQYMVNKDILNRVHEGNVKKQRNQAKLNADDVQFISFSEMWRTDGTPAVPETREPAEE